MPLSHQNTLLQQYTYLAKAEFVQASLMKINYKDHLTGHTIDNWHPLRVRSARILSVENLAASRLREHLLLHRPLGLRVVATIHKAE